MTLAEASPAIWSGSEWKHLYGKGCWYCPWEPPVVKLDHVAVCFSCFCRAFPGLADDQVGDWLMRQVEQSVELAKRQTKEAKEARFERDMAAVMEWLTQK